MKKIMLLMLAMLLIIPAVFAQTYTDEQCDQTTDSDVAAKCIEQKIGSIINLITTIAGGLAVIAAIIIGIMFVNTSDPAQKDMLASRLKMLVVGIVIIGLANPIVKALI